MPREPRTGLLKYRVLDSNSGAELIGDLPHLHQSIWTPRAMVPGMPGSATLGDFTLPLHPARSDEGRKYKQAYDLLDKGQRVEAYPGDDLTGTPGYSGVITSIDRPLDGPWIAHGSDSLWWLQQSQLFAGEQLGPAISPSTLVNLFAGTREVVYDQWATALNQTFGTWSTVGADPQFGLPALSSTSSAGSVATSTPSWNATGEYNWPTLPSGDYCSQITVWGTILMGTDTSNSGDMGLIWLSDATGANCYLAELVTNYTGAASTGWHITVKLWSIVGGTASSLITFTNVMQVSSSTFPFQFSVTLLQLNNLGHIIQTFVNGQGTGAYSFSVLTNTSGKVGARVVQAASNGGTTYVNRIRFSSRTGQGTTWGTNRFQVGSATTSTAVVPYVAGNGQSNLDMMVMALSLDGYQLRKTPKRGYKADILDYGPSLGRDLTASVRFEEGQNIQDQGTAVMSVADLFSSWLRLNAVPGFDSGGSVTWGPLASVGDMELIDSVAEFGLPGYALQFAYAMQLAARKANPLQALQVGVLLDSETFGKFGLLDRVTVNIPTLRIHNQAAQVIGYTFTEGSPVMPVFLNQFPSSQVQLPMQRLTRAAEFLSGTYANR